MSKKLKYLIKVSLLRKISSKWFLVVNIILALAIIGLINIDTIINLFGGDFNKKTKIVVIDHTKQAYQLFSSSIKGVDDLTNEEDKECLDKLIVSESKEKEEDLIAKIKDNKEIIIVFEDDQQDVIKARIISNSYLDGVLQQKLIAAINVVKSSLTVLKYNINYEQLAQINTPALVERIYLDESKTQSEENMNLIMSIVFPTIILPFFFLIIFLIQMLGAEINEEKTTRGMEIIISNVSPQTHFTSKVLASNLFVILQGSVLFISAMMGIFIRSKVNSTAGSILPEGINIKALWLQLVESGFADKLIYIIPLTLILIVLSFLAYSLLAGILASMTTSMEDYQQLQTPIIFVSFAGYYLSIMAPMFEGSIFIKVIATLPFFSALMTPALLVVGQFGIKEVLLAILLLLGLIYLMVTYGMKIYKVGILNYSTTKLWSKMFKAIKQ